MTISWFDGSTGETVTLPDPEKPGERVEAFVEARRRYPYDPTQVIGMFDGNSRTREAFERGATWQRGREPTDAEVRAAAREVCAALLEERQRTRMIIDGLSVKSIQSNPLIVTFSNGARLHVDKLTRLVLEAAREEVSQ